MQAYTSRHTHQRFRGGNRRDHVDARAAPLINIMSILAATPTPPAWILLV